MIEGSSAAILDAEIINDERELDAVGCMGEKTWDIWILEVALSGEVLDEMLVGEVRSLWQAMHAFVNPEKYSVIVNESV